MNKQTNPTNPTNPTTQLVVVCYDNIKIWDLESKQSRQTLRYDDNYVFGAKFSRDKKVLASAGLNVKLWDITSEENGVAKMVQHFVGHDDHAKCVDFSANGNLLASGSWDKKAIVWDIETGKSLLKLNGHNEEIVSLAFTADDKYLVTGGMDGCCNLWDVASGRLVQYLASRSDSSVDTIATTNGYVSAGYRDGGIDVWNDQTFKIVHQIRDSQMMVNSSVFSHDSQYLASSIGYDTDEIKIRQIETNNVVKCLPIGDHNKMIYSLAFSDDDKWFASGCRDGVVKIWDLSKKDECALHCTLQEHKNTILDMAFC